jgi:hypothetical protein
MVAHREMVGGEGLEAMESLVQTPQPQSLGMATTYSLQKYKSLKTKNLSYAPPVASQQSNFYASTIIVVSADQLF